MVTQFGWREKPSYVCGLPGEENSRSQLWRQSCKICLVRMPRDQKYIRSLCGLESISISTDHFAVLEVENLKKYKIMNTITYTFLPYYTRGPPVLEEL